MLFDAPYEITNEFLLSLNIQYVIKGSDPTTSSQLNGIDKELNMDPFQIPREMNILRIVDVAKKMSGTVLL